MSGQYQERYEYFKLYREKNNERLQQKRHEYYEENKDKLQEQTKQWKQDNPERLTTHSASPPMIYIKYIEIFFEFFLKFFLISIEFLKFFFFCKNPASTVLV